MRRVVAWLGLGFGFGFGFGVGLGLGLGLRLGLGLGLGCGVWLPAAPAARSPSTHAVKPQLCRVRLTRVSSRPAWGVLV